MSSQQILTCRQVLLLDHIFTSDLHEAHNVVRGEVMGVEFKLLISASTMLVFSF